VAETDLPRGAVIAIGAAYYLGFVGAGILTVFGTGFVVAG
jgi:ornithine cyclodeaminase/alanine dehydrogenase-like protein (mu-crystallin family)